MKGKKGKARINDLRKLGSFFLWLCLGLAFFEIFISSCASKSSPGGGPKDTLAPQLDTAFPPNQTILFKAQEIELRFEEYVDLKNPFNQVNISPLLNEDLEVRGKGKKVFIKLTDSLKPNTTYIISFGSSLADLTEGNVNKDFKYVFSTGTYIDSLEIGGVLRDAYSGEAQAEFLVALYSADRASARDSFLQVERPDYYAFSDKEGRFKMTNIKGGRYILAAFTDKDGDFKRSNPKEAIAFWNDTLLISADTVFQLDLFTYEPEQEFRFINARQAGPGHLQFAFNKPADSFQVKALDVPEDSAFFYYSTKRDTLNYYYNFMADSIRFELNYDTLFVDSMITVRLRQMQPIDLIIKADRKEMRPRDTIKFRSNRPILSWQADSVWYISAKDSLHKVPVADSLDPFIWYFLPPHRADVRFEMKKGAMRARGLESKVARSFDFKLRSGEDLGSIFFKVKTNDSSAHYLLQILEKDDRPYRLLPFQDSLELKIRQEIPRVLKAYLIEDRDSNGVFTPGNFKLNQLPERRVPYQESLEIRANWELDLEWQFQPAP